MSLSSRRILGALIAVVVFLAVGGTVAWRLAIADREGWTGMNYMPREAKGGAGPLAPFGFKQGSVIIVYPASPAERAGIKPRDQIESMNGVPITNWPALAKLDTQLKSGSRVVVRLVHDKVARDVPLVLESELRSPLLGLNIASSILVGLVYLFIGTIIFWRRPDDRRVTIFFAVTLIAYISFVGIPLVQTTNMHGVAPPQNLSFLPQMMFIIAAGLLFAPTLLHLALIFPKPRPIVARRPEIFRWLYAPPLLLLPALVWMLVFTIALASKKHGPFWKFTVAGAAAGGALILFAALRVALKARTAGMRDAFLRQPVWTTILGLGVLASAITLVSHFTGAITGTIIGVVVTALACIAFGIYPVATVIALFRSYRDSGVEERQQVKWPLWATIVAVGVKLIVFTVSFITGTTNILQQKPLLALGLLQGVELIPKLFYILIPLSFAFAIVKYRLMNIDLIIRRTVTYALLSVVVFIAYAVLLVGVGAMLVHLAGVRNQAVLVGSTIVVALIAVPLRNTLQRVVDRNVFRERVSYPLALRTLADAVSGGAGREELPRLLAEQLQQALHNRMVLVAMRSDQHFVATAKVGVADEVLGSFRVPAAGVALARPLDPERDALPPELAQRLRRLGAKLVVPMRAQRDAIGFVALGAKLSNEPFSAEDLEFIGNAATQAAMALETSRLRTEEVEFEQARAMQQILLPKSLPHLDGFGIAGMWQPARSVGGDYYDAIALGDGKAALCIADVAGKGMPAALLMASVQAAVKAIASADMPPRRLCDKVRNIVAGNLAGGTFITFFYALLDADTRTLTYCNAGHNPPLLVRGDGVVERLATGGSVLGRLFRDESYEEATVTLAPGDRVVLFTDGVSEARRAGEDFGDERLIDVVRSNRELPAEELQEKIVEAITTFTSGSFGDDVTLVVIGAQ